MRPQILSSGFQVKKHMHQLLKRINIDADVEEVLLVAPGSILPYMRTGVERSFEVRGTPHPPPPPGGGQGY